MRPRTTTTHPPKPFFSGGRPPSVLAACHGSSATRTSTVLHHDVGRHSCAHDRRAPPGGLWGGDGSRFGRRQRKGNRGADTGTASAFFLTGAGRDTIGKEQVDGMDGVGRLGEDLRPPGRRGHLGAALLFAASPTSRVDPGDEGDPRTARATARRTPIARGLLRGPSTPGAPAAPIATLSAGHRESR
jgi:hypothetical protein